MREVIQTVLLHPFMLMFFFRQLNFIGQVIDMHCYRILQTTVIWSSKMHQESKSYSYLELCKEKVTLYMRMHTV